MSHALQNPKYESIIKKYFSHCISLADHKFSALHYAVWSGGTFLYIPK
jgi:Fe-S cluster assembly protein SufB